MSAKRYEVHTTAPWYCVNDWHEIHDRPTFYDAQGARIGPTPNRICIVDWHPISGREANARLIGAAPELLAALEVLVFQLEQMGSCDYVLDAARAAIAKARKE